MSKPLIQFSHLVKSYGSFLLFDDISLSINQGEIFALVGDNAVGKTTLLQILAGNTLLDKGDLSRDSSVSIGFLPQEVTLQPNLLVGSTQTREQRV